MKLLKTPLLTVALIFVSLSGKVEGQVVLFDFGTDNFSRATFGNDFNLVSQDGSSIEISGNAGNQLSGSLSNPISIDGVSSVTVYGISFSGSGGFEGIFRDSNLNSSTFTGGSFGDLATSNSSSLVFSESETGFQATNVTSFQIAGSGAPSTLVSGTLTNVQAIPEPSAYATILGLLGLGYAVFCRRRRSSSQE